tara:strand:- start:657 stop:1124 length:468 start_codon:yes stop_codon:yes gene_type:complete
MAKNKTPLQALFEKGDLPGITQADVVNQAHPGYMQAAPDPNIIAPAGTNIFGQPTAPLTQEDLINMITGMGSPMAMGTVAKGGSSLLQRLLAKFKQDRAIQKSIARQKNKPELNFQNRKADRIEDMEYEQMMRGYKNAMSDITLDMTLDELMKKL